MRRFSERLMPAKAKEEGIFSTALETGQGAFEKVGLMELLYLKLITSTPFKFCIQK